MAQLDPSIIAGVKMPNFGETYGNALLAGSEIASNRAKAESEQAALERQNKYQQALTAPIPQGMTRRDALAQQGFLQEALELDKAEGEADKLKAEAGIKQGEGTMQVQQVGAKLAQELASRPDLSPEIVAQTTDAYYTNGLLPPAIYEKMRALQKTLPQDQEGLRKHFQALVMAAQEPDKQAQYISPDANAQLQAQTSTQNAQLGAQTTMRGQDLGYDMNTQELGLKRQGQEFNQQMDVNKFGLETDKYQTSLNPKTSGKPPTEFQGKSALYANRAEEAEKELSSLDYSPASIGTKEALANTPLVGGMLGAGYNTVMSETNQKAEQAQRNFINAILRQESGAVISPSEFENAKKQYFPAVGDTDATKAQKAANRRTAIESIRNNAEGVVDTGIGGRSNTGGAPSWTPEKIQSISQKHGLSPEELKAYYEETGGK
jgi:hypothetical protein